MENKNDDDVVVDSWEDVAGDKEIVRKIEEKLHKDTKMKFPDCQAQPSSSSDACVQSMSDAQLSAQGVVKILKRPTGTNAARDKSTAAALAPPDTMGRTDSKGNLRSLEEREAAYAEARLRIFGTLGSEDSQNADSPVQRDAQVGAAGAPQSGLSAPKILPRNRSFDVKQPTSTSAKSFLS